MSKMVLTLAIITINSGEVATSLSDEVVMSLSPLCVVGCWISGLLTVSMDSLYSNLKVVMKPKHSKAAFEDIEKSCH